MKTRVPDYYKDFKCIADKCEDTCCAGWEIVIDDETYEKYEKVKGDFGLRLKNEIFEDEEGDKIFTLKGNDCAFLNKNKMCDIYSELGEDALCYTCQQYPRYTEEYGSIREVGLSLSCPEAARIMLNDSKKVEFILNEDDEMVTAYNDISYEMFMQLMSSRKVIFQILQDRSLEIKHRLSLILLFGEEIQDKIDKNCVKQIADVREKYEDSQFQKTYIEQIDKFKNNEEKKCLNIIRYFEEYKKLDHINEKWPEVIDYSINYIKSKTNCEEYIKEHEEFNKYHEHNDYEYEQLFVYFIFRYFMKAVYDYDVIAKIKLTIVSYLMIKELNVIRYFDNNNEFTKHDQIDIMHMYSKDIEHSEENLEELAKIFDENKEFSYENLLIMLLN